MISIERYKPENLKKGIFIPLIGHEGKKDYLEELEKFERKCEESIIDTLSRLSINAIVKKDRFSLPYKEEIITTLYGESYLNGPYEFYRVARNIAKELLNRNTDKIRFYILIEVNENSDKFFNLGKVVYKFRYYSH